MKRFAAALAALALAACGQPEEPAAPALWEVTGPNGAHGYLFGTIHAVGEDVDWRGPAIERAFADADMLVVEAAGVTNPEATARAWQELARARGEPPLTKRVPREHAGEVKAALDRTGLDESNFSETETWAAALTLANELREEDGDGIDLALLRDRGGKRVASLEGVSSQLKIFDRLPASDQSALLAAVAEQAIDDPGGEARLARLWRTGDIDAIAAETRKGVLADPDLRAALLVNRNRAWAERIEELLRSRAVPFVAVGAAHLAGPDGLPALLAARGYRVRRLQ